MGWFSFDLMRVWTLPAKPAAVRGAAVAWGLSGAALTPPGYAQQAHNLGTAASFGVLAGSTVTNTGSSVITGNVGVSPGSAVTGFPPGIVNAPGTIHKGDAVAQMAQSDLTK